MLGKRRGRVSPKVTGNEYRRVFESGQRRGGGLSPSDLGPEEILGVCTENGGLLICAEEGRVLNGGERTSLGCERGVWEVLSQQVNIRELIKKQGTYGSVEELGFRNTHPEESRYLVEVSRSSRIPPESK